MNGEALATLERTSLPSYTVSGSKHWAALGQECRRLVSSLSLSGQAR
jgi:hypothetical protein